MADLVYVGEETGGIINADAMPGNVDIQIYKGDFVDIYATMKDSANVIMNLTGYTAKAQLKTLYTDLTPIDFTCSLPNGGVDGVVRIYLPSSISSSLLPGPYIWDFQLTFPTGAVRTFMTGDVTVLDEVTI